MDFEDVSVPHLMIGADHATRATVDAPNEACFQIGVHPSGHRLRGDACGHHERIGKNAPVTVDPSALILHRVDHDALEGVEHHRVEQRLNTGATGRGQGCAHPFQSNALGIGQGSILGHLEVGVTGPVADKT